MSKIKTIAVSGGFDPVHIGHVRMIQDAAKHGTCGFSSIQMLG